MYLNPTGMVYSGHAAAVGRGAHGRPIPVAHAGFSVVARRCTFKQGVRGLLHIP